MPAVLNLNWGVWQKPLVDKILIKAVYYNNPGNPGQENGQKFKEWLQGKKENLTRILNLSPTMEYR